MADLTREQEGLLGRILRHIVKHAQAALDVGEGPARWFHLGAISGNVYWLDKEILPNAYKEDGESDATCPRQGNTKEPGRR